MRGESLHRRPGTDVTPDRHTFQSRLQHIFPLTNGDPDLKRKEEQREEEKEKRPNDRRDLLPLLLSHYLNDTRIGSIFPPHRMPVIHADTHVNASL
jgi:hypothetical protein